MTEDDGYETIVPDLSAVKVEQVDRDAAWPMLSDFNRGARHRAGWDAGEYDENPSIQAFARHRQAAYNQALKDAAEVAATVIVEARCGDIDTDLRCIGHILESRILSIGDKGNG